METFVLDTNVLLLYLRGEEKVLKSFKDLGLFEENKTIVISIVSFAEMKALAKKRKWSVHKTQDMNEYLKSFLIIPIESEDILKFMQR